MEKRGERDRHDDKGREKRGRRKIAEKRRGKEEEGNVIYTTFYLLFKSYGILGRTGDQGRGAKVKYFKVSYFSSWDYVGTRTASYGW